MSSSKTIKYKCPFCDKRFIKEDLVIHVGDEHDDMIPEGFTPLRYIFNYVNKRSTDYHGKCTECGGPTPWDENKGRYNRQCDKPACKESYIKKFEENMQRTKGVTRISSTPEGQEKMLANRKISGKYKFQNGVEKTYTGSYELKTLQFMDKIMNIDPDDILCPGPVLEYELEGVKHFYITDFYYQPYNLIIEVKDGGKRPNTRSMPEYRAKQIAKEQYIVKHTDYNYLRLTDNDLSQLLAVFADLKMQLVENTGKRVIHINEAMNALMTGYIPGIEDPGSVYIVNYMRNNVFSGEEEIGYGISDNPKLTNLICRNKEGLLSKAPDDFLENCSYDVYRVDFISPKEISKKLAPYMNTLVSEGFIYETVFDKKMYTYDQIMTESRAYPVIDYYKGLELLENAVRNYLVGNKQETLIESDYSIMSMDFDPTSKDKTCVCYFSIKENSGTYVLESVDYPEIRIRGSEFMDKDSIESKFIKGLCFKKG